MQSQPTPLSSIPDVEPLTLQEDHQSPILITQKRKERPKSVSFSDWDELGQIVKQAQSSKESKKELQSPNTVLQAQTSSYKTLKKASASSTSSTDSQTLSQTPPTTPNSQNSFTSALSDFPLEEWDFEIVQMDINTSNVNTGTIRMSAQNAFDLNLPPNEESIHAEMYKTKRMKIQQKTKGKEILKYGLSEGELPEQGNSGEESSNVNPDHPLCTQGELRKETTTSYGAADPQPSMKK